MNVYASSLASIFIFFLFSSSPPPPPSSYPPYHTLPSTSPTHSSALTALSPSPPSVPTRPRTLKPISLGTFLDKFGNKRVHSDNEENEGGEVSSKGDIEEMQSIEELENTIPNSPGK
ncbi:uncharacterized protein EAE97_008439 [Botrytis byssoidea]|uniref:Uncharacterized protein n=1 Tax=Botrytis byssoidea TaxID=139641 RepID=A0A9P5IET3_9HELO|nr:uncharacterized protein EAE97_008439 [Botrytis byssoidea]KAF7934079.1 hypothetical protein EAE97_008439 [Botrytis byssoidea]